MGLISSVNTAKMGLISSVSTEDIQPRQVQSHQLIQPRWVWSHQFQNKTYSQDGADLISLNTRLTAKMGLISSVWTHDLQPRWVQSHQLILTANMGLISSVSTQDLQPRWGWSHQFQHKTYSQDGFSRLVSLASLACCLSFSLDHLLVAPCTGRLLDCWLATVTWADYQREKSKVNDTVSDFSFIQRYWGTAEGEREVPVDCKITVFRNAHSTLSVSMAWCTFPPPQQPNFNILPTAQGHIKTCT